jgi:hypothetical protein
MEEALQFFKAYEFWIYVGLGALALWQIRKFAISWEELRGAVFGMERENAQARINQSAAILLLLLVLAFVEFMAVTFIVPSVPGALPLPTATLDLLATATITLPAGTPLPDTTQTPISSQEPIAGEGCTPEQINFTTPVDGDEVSGVVVLIGTVDVPNLGFYKYELARPGETIWLPIQVGEQVKRDEELGTWDTSNLAPGTYALRLVVTDNQGATLQPCVIQVRVVAPNP